MRRCRILPLVFGLAALFAVSASSCSRKNRIQTSPASGPENTNRQAPRLSLPVAASGEGTTPHQVSETANRHLHRTLAGEVDERELVRLVTSRELREEELRVLERLLAEKRGELEGLNRRLSERFAVAPGMDYSYDADRRTLFALAPSGTGAVTGASAAPHQEAGAPQTAHRVLAGPEEEREFLQLIEARDITDQEMSSLHLLQEEKSIEARRLYDALAAQFGIQRHLNYEYRRDERVIYQLVPAAAAPPGASEAHNP